MNAELLKVRLRKLTASVMQPTCWRALALGVTPAIEHRAVLRLISIDGILDVGANRGQFTLMCRLTQPAVPVVAFEPIPAEAATFRKVHGDCSTVTLIESALGESHGNATLHLSQSADSSSLLPIGEKQAELFENTSEIGTIEVSISRLDHFHQHWKGRFKQMLKLDVQGYELNVLRGAVETLRSCDYVYAECSEVVLYDGQALRVDVQEFLRGQGFEVKSRHNEQIIGGRLIQADYLFTRM